MTTPTDTQTAPEGTPEASAQPVDRARRARFIASVVGFCLISAAGFTAIVAWAGVTAIYLPIVELFISGMLSLAMATTLAYVGGSVLDYNGGVGNMFTRSNNRYSDNNYVYPDAQG